MKLVYISGAITGATLEERMQFHLAAQWLELHSDFYPWNPLDHDLPGADTKEEGWINALSRDIAVIAPCYGICVLDSYERSKGALLEIFVACALNKRIIRLPHQSESWEEKIRGQMTIVRDFLYKNVDALRYPHHQDIARIASTLDTPARIG